MKRILLWTGSLILFLATVVPCGAKAGTVTAESVTAGSFYTCATCDQSLKRSFVAVGGYIHGGYTFLLEGHEPVITEATLVLRSSSISPDSFATINVIGYDGGGATTYLSATGEFLGVWKLSDRVKPTYNYLFDVTDFVRTAESGVVGFRLQGISGFNSFAVPGKLIITSVPEPGTLGIAVAMSIACMGYRPLRRPKNRRSRDQ